MGKAAKRVFDIAVTAALLVVMAPVFLVVALAVRWKDGGPVLFRQRRPGLHAKPFTLLKFRTMKEAAAGPDAIASDSERLTALGRTLRRWSLDELPQLWNVIKGEMSLVGPRPLLTQYLARYTAEQARRHEALPGITGWAQVNGRNAQNWEQRLADDVWYVEHRSFALDMRILLITLWRVLKRQGISSPGQATMPEFMGKQKSATSSR